MTSHEEVQLMQNKKSCVMETSELHYKVHYYQSANCIQLFAFDCDDISPNKSTEITTFQVYLTVINLQALFLLTV